MKQESALLAEKVKDILDAKKGLDITSIDISDMTVLADCFVVASGATVMHVRALADNVMEALEAEGIKPVREDGYEQGVWIVLDYGDVMVHLFRQEEREFYDLERLWLEEKNFAFHDNAMHGEE